MGDWLTIIIVLLILGILLDGWRRMRNAQRDSLKVSRSMRKSASSSPSERDDFNSVELPNGGARVVAYRDSSGSEPRDSSVRTRPRPSASKVQSVEREKAPEQPAWEEADEGPEYEEHAFLEEPELDDSELHSQELTQDEIEDAQVEASHSAMPHRSRSTTESPEMEEDGQTTAIHDEGYQPVPQESEPSARRHSAETRGRIPQQVALNLDESVPILMETTENEEDQRQLEQDDLDESERIEPTFGGANGGATKRSAQSAKESFSEDRREKDSRVKELRAKSKPSFGGALGASLSSKALQAKEAFSAKLASSGLMSNSSSQDEEEVTPQEAPPKSTHEPEARPTPQAPRARAAAKAPPPAPAQPEEVLIVNIMAPQGHQFQGTPLLDALIRAGLRFGDMNIFHRYEESRGGGPILFSLANMVKPGFFDLDSMDEFSTPGVSLFMTLPLDNARQENVEVFELMLDSARAIAGDLGGELKDENRSVMTRQTMEHCRQRIHEFERKQLSRAPN